MLGNFCLIFTKHFEAEREEGMIQLAKLILKVYKITV
jgi:hypothetical protein